MGVPLLEALEAGDLSLASSIAPPLLPQLSPFLITEYNRGLWNYRLARAAEDPENIPWLSRVVVCQVEKDTGSQGPVQECSEPFIVGRIGFHNKPDENGMVEVGYAIDPEHRRKGHASAALRVMVDIARSTEGVEVLRATVDPENWISRRIVEGAGLRKVGTQMHEKRGVEDVFDLGVRA